jgi:capsular exopolysaccharide synthesis family protein
MPQYELNLRDYWQIVQKRRGVMLFVFFAVVISSVIYTNLQKPIYRAIAAVQWQESKRLTQMLTEIVMVKLGDPLVSQTRIINSQPVLEKAVIEAGLAGKDASPQEVNNIISFLKGAVSTEIIPNTNIIRIYVTHGDPKMAAQIANKVAEAYIWRNLEDKLKEVRQLKQFVEERLSDFEIKLKNSEEALANFKEKEVPSGIAIPLQNRLADLETKRSELLQRYTELHPEIKEIEKQISIVKEQLKQMPEKELEYSRLTRDVELYNNFYRMAREKLEFARIAEAEKLPETSLVDPADVPGSPISPNKRLNYFLGTVIGLMLGLACTFVFEQLDTSIGTIEDVESYLKSPALGVIPYLRTAEDKKRNFIQRLWPKEFIGKEKTLRLRSQLLIHYSSSSPIFEAYRILRTNIQTEVFKEKIQGKILLFSSSGPEEGKSITISNLAIVMAQGGLHTLLIDADMRRSSIHKIFGLRQKEPGLCDILNGTIEPKEAIRTFTDILMGELGFDEALKIPGLDNLNILTSGSSTTNPAELISSAEMATLLVKLKEKFDLILVDSPPVLAVADPAILAPKTDGIILVYRVGKTARSVILRAKTQLIGSGVSVKGVILNNISPEIEMRYGYYYQYKYYGKYYGEKKEET